MPTHPKLTEWKFIALSTAILVSETASAHPGHPEPGLGLGAAGWLLLTVLGVTALSRAWVHQRRSQD